MADIRTMNKPVVALGSDLMRSLLELPKKAQDVYKRQELLKNPPDILLTNYKMLDYLLVRPKDSRIWDNNDPDTVSYTHLDVYKRQGEMHGHRGRGRGVRLSDRYETRHGYASEEKQFLLVQDDA